MTNLGNSPMPAVGAQLIQLLKEGRPPSPLILEGEGRGAFLSQFVAAIFCETHSGCGHCGGCKKVAKGFHPDWLQLPEDFKMEDVREALGKLRQRPFEASYRLLCLEGLESQQVAIQNALLKTLEEPSPRWILLISVESRWVLLNTVRSRCLLVHLSAPATVVDDESQSLTEAEARILESVSSQTELSLIQDLEPYFKDREKARLLWVSLLKAASRRGYPGHWRRFAPHLDAGIQDLSRNLHQKNIWDRAWVRSLEGSLS